MTVAPGVPDAPAGLCFDPQTSGGLFFAAPGAVADAVEEAFAREGAPLWRVGRFVPGRGVRVV